MPRSVAVILGSAYRDRGPAGLPLVPRTVSTRFGDHELFAVDADLPRPAFVVFRHGQPHRWLPHQIPWRRQAAALAALDVGALLVTSSVGVLDGGVPLHRPLLVSDLLMPDNRLPDGSSCTIFETPSPGQGHLVLEEGLFSLALAAQVEVLAERLGTPIAGRPVFAFVPGPRTKTRAENRAWAALGAQVNSMSLGPEVVLANELGIACAGLVIGHKYSTVAHANTAGRGEVAGSLDDARAAMEALVVAFLLEGEPVPFRNQLFRFGDSV